MKTTLSRAWLAAFAAMIALPSPGWGLDIRIPHPKKVVREARGAVHRVAREVEGAGRRVVQAVDSDRQGSARSRTANQTGAAGKSPVAKPPAGSGSGTGLSTVKPPLSEAELVPQGPGAMEPLRSDSAAQEVLSPNVPEGASNPVPQRGGDRPIPSKDLPAIVAPSPEAGVRTQMLGSQAAPSDLRGATDRSKEKTEVPYARPVPGKKGLVYSPGADETSEAIVDVRDIAPGTLVKNPRTGVLFRVP